MRVLKRKKGREGYFYLQHSFRKGGKVVTKEAYLGKKIPENIEEIKQNFMRKIKQDLYAKLEKIRESFKKEWDKLPETAKKREIEEIAIAFTYNTDAIEGSTITLEETRGIIQDKISPNNRPLKDIKEAEAHYKAFLGILESKEKISSNLLLKWHKEIFQETKPDIAGKFRNYLVRIADYLAPDWQDIKNLMSRFIKSANVKINPAELAARMHYKFEKIHPFGDGNGRVGRLLMNYILWRNNYPMLIIEYKNKKSYYKALKKDEESFVNYFLRRYLSVHNRRYLQQRNRR